MPEGIKKNLQYYKFCLYGFFKNLRLFDAFLILFLLDNGLSYVQIGGLYSIREIVLALSEIPSGAIADALGRRRTLITSFFFYILSFIIFYFAAHFYWFAFAMLAFAFGDAFRTGVHKAMIYQYLKENQWKDQMTDYYGHTRSWSQIGSAISALAGAAVVFFSGNLRMIFLISTIPYLLDAALIYSYPKNLDGDKVPLSATALKRAFKEVAVAFLQTFKKWYFIKVFTNASIYTGYYRAAKDYIQPLLQSFALGLPVMLSLQGEQKTALIVGTIYSISFLINAFASRNSGKVASLFTSPNRPLNLTILAGFFLGIATGLTFHFNVYVVSIICFIMVLAVENLRKPMSVALISKHSRDQAMASVLSASSQAKSIFAAVLAPLLGYFADTVSPGVALAVVAAALILAAPLYWLKGKPVE